jgi:hypothetical protein
MRTKRAEPIKQYNPRFEEDGFVQGRDYDPDRERAEKKKLRKQLKKETKGAARELRKVGKDPLIGLFFVCCSIGALNDCRSSERTSILNSCSQAFPRPHCSFRCILVSDRCC